MVARTKEIGCTGCGLTDHGLVAGHVPFHKAMREAGLRPILGLEAYHARVSRKVTPDAVPYVDKNGRKRTKKPRDAAHLVLLAKNAEGLRNLNILSDESNRSGFYYAPRLDWELLEKHHEGIIATSACLSGLVARGIEADDRSDLERYLGIFGSDFYLELHTYAAAKQRTVNRELWSVAQSRGIPVVFASDAHYCDASQHEIHEMLLCMQMASDLSSPKNLSPDGEVDEDHSHDGAVNHFHPKSLYMLSETEVRDSLAYLPASAVDEAIANSDLIASRCSVELPETRLHMPVFKVPESACVEFSDNNQLALLEMMEKGLVERYGDDVPQEVLDRAEYEYETLTEVDLGGGATLGDYFLINWDWITNFCKPQGILTGPGRGSAGGSLLAYALGITHIDPIKYNLQFERFWNPGRASGFPDIDTDVEQGKRGTVKEYLIDKYGADKVLSIGTHICHQPKSAIESAAKAFFGRERMKEEFLYDEVDAIKALIEKTVDAGKQPDWETLWDSPVADELHSFKHQSSEWTKVFEVAQAITGRIANYGIHASAVVISDISLPETMPCRSATPPKGQTERQLVTQVEMGEVESLGFLKLDLLGLRNLDTLALTAKLAGSDTEWWSIDYDRLPDESWELLDKGLTLGLFQVEEGRAAKDIAKRLKPRNLKDLAAIVALNRPGPLRSGAVDRFLARRNGEEEVLYPHPILEDILEHTYGEMIYQEDVLAYFRKIGYSWAEADMIRYYMGKKRVEAMKAEYPRYLERASEFMTEEEARHIWDLMEDFSKYGFNIPHAACYGMILGATLVAKT